MNFFPVPPDYCLVVKAFNDTPSLREAAKMLGTDPGALARKVQKISEEYGLFYKIGNKWVITEIGKSLCHWVDESISLQLRLLNHTPTFKISSTPWLTEQTLIPYSSRLNELTKGNCSWDFHLISNNLETELLNSRVDFALTNHPPYDPDISHKKIIVESWVLVAPTSWSKDLEGLNEEEIKEFLSQKPYIKHGRVNCESYFGFTPGKVSDLKVNDLMGVRSGVIAGLGWSCIPSLSVKSYIERGEIYKISLETVSTSYVTLWWPRVRKDLDNYAKTLSEWVYESIEKAG